MKRNTLTTAVLAGLTGMAGMVSVSNATGVHVNPEGTGQVLIYPFYTARGGNDTLISIVNTNERGKAVKVRFREALNSREVLDFQLYLSPFDVWTASISASDDDDAAILTTFDNSCTVPNIDETQEFLRFDYAQEANEDANFSGTEDGGPTGFERTQSGYIEVIEMGTMIARGDLTEPESAGDLEEGHIEWASKHNANGIPNSCQTLIDAWTSYAGVDADEIPVAGGKWLTDPGFGLDAPSGGLFGSASIINPTDGTMFTYNAVALENFWGEDDEAKAAQPEDSSIHTRPGIDAPNLASTTNKTSHVLFNGVMEPQTFDLGIQAVSAALTQSRIANEYATLAEIGAQTEWVITFPTKAYHVDPFQASDGLGNSRGGAVTGSQAVAPFTALWDYDGTDLTAACESFNLIFWDREEQGLTPPEVDDPEAPDPVDPRFSPEPFVPPTPDPDPEIVRPAFSLCSEANVVAFSDIDTTLSVGDATGILGEPVRSGGLGAVNAGLPFDSGWAFIDLVTAFTEGSGSLTPLPDRISIVADPQNDEVAAIAGLPVVGFAVTTYTNNSIDDGVLANYGGSFNHRGSRSITSSGQE